MAKRPPKKLVRKAKPKLALEPAPKRKEQIRLQLEPRAVRKRRILVIEDQPDAARILGIAVSMLGHDVRVAGTGVDGLELARAFGPEIVLCDLALPGMNGFEVAREFRRDHVLRNIYLVALSGYAQPEDVERTVDAGFSCHVAKPASLATLAKVISAVP